MEGLSLKPARVPYVTPRRRQPFSARSPSHFGDHPDSPLVLHPQGHRLPVQPQDQAQLAPYANSFVSAIMKALFPGGRSSIRAASTRSLPCLDQDYYARGRKLPACHLRLFSFRVGAKLSNNMTLEAYIQNSRSTSGASSAATPHRNELLRAVLKN